MADRFVVDTSVFLRWYVPQIGFEHAREVRQGTLRFFDAVLVDRALQGGMPLLTSDRKLANAVGTVASIEILRGSRDDRRHLATRGNRHSGPLQGVADRHQLGGGFCELGVGVGVGDDSAAGE